LAIEQDGSTWRYRNEDLRPWDNGNDLIEFERDYMVQVHQRHKTPIMRTSSLMSVESKVNNVAEKLSSSAAPGGDLIKEGLLGQILNNSPSQDSESSSVCFYFFLLTCLILFIVLRI
jgi:hypothetical protein